MDDAEASLAERGKDIASATPKAAASPATTSASAASGRSMRILEACRASAAANTPRRLPQTPENASWAPILCCDRRTPIPTFSSSRRGTSTSLLTFFFPILAKGQLTISGWVSKNVTGSRGHGNTAADIKLHVPRRYSCSLQTVDAVITRK